MMFQPKFRITKAASPYEFYEKHNGRKRMCNTNVN